MPWSSFASSVTSVKPAASRRERAWSSVKLLAPGSSAAVPADPAGAWPVASAPGAGVAGSTQRHARPVRAVGVLVLLARHGGGDLAGRHAVRGDPGAAQLERERLHQAAEPVLGGVVRARPDPRLVLVHAGHGDQPPVAAAVQDAPRRPLEADEGPVEVDGDGHTLGAGEPRRRVNDQRDADPDQRTAVVTVGRKGRDAMRRARVPLAAHFEGYGDRPSFADVIPLARLITDEVLRRA